MNASEIVQLLAIRHSKDVFVPECKNGPTQTANHLRLDAWAMARSWVNPRFDGYEIKVSRGDFLADQKMRLYLPLCNRLWVVCPSGLVKPEEVDPQIGLLWVASTGNRLLTKRRAPYREIDPPVGLLLYVLMCRVRIEREYYGAKTREERADYWKHYIEGRMSMRAIGWNAGKKIRNEIEENLRLVDRFKAQSEAAESRAANLEAAQRTLDSLGISPGQWNLKDALTDALSGKRVEAAIASAHRAIADVAKELGLVERKAASNR